MKPAFNKTLGVSLAVALIACVNSAVAETLVIVHPTNRIAALSTDEVARIYLGKLRSFPGGGHVDPIDQSEGSAARKAFCATYLDMTEADVKRQWSKLMFSGKGRPPVEVDGDQAVKAAVTGNTAAIGYIDSANVDDSVKVIDVKP